ncbi:hypothetical protein MMC25_003376 [Agyrium rufum]|nr:hypothetical protein [Agyrium rufum]
MNACHRPGITAVEALYRVFVNSTHPRSATTSFLLRRCRPQRTFSSFTAFKQEQEAPNAFDAPPPEKQRVSRRQKSEDAPQRPVQQFGPSRISPLGKTDNRTARVFGPAKTRRYDEEIQSTRIRLVEDDGKLNPEVFWLRQTLSTMDRKQNFLVQVSRADDSDTSDSASSSLSSFAPLGDNIDGLPICKIMPKQEAREYERAKTQPSGKNKGANAGMKILEFGWAIDAHDLAHRMGKLKEMLEEGRKVEVAIGRRKKKGVKKKDVTVEEAQRVLGIVKASIKEVNGARESRATEQGKGMVIIFAEGKIKKKDAGKGKGTEEVEGAKEEATEKATKEFAIA